MVQGSVQGVIRERNGVIGRGREMDGWPGRMRHREKEIKEENRCEGKERVRRKRMDMKERKC